MYPHHETSIEKLKDYFASDTDVLALAVGGSVAKGLARADSDIDALVIVTEPRYARLAEENRLSECIFGHCTYEGGYFDLKYFTLPFLRAAAQRGSEPTRNQFAKARLVACHSAEIERLIPQIGVFQQSEKDEKMASFYAALALYAGYFWHSSKTNPYLRVRCAADILLFGYRLLLQENGVLFPSHKALLQTVAALPNKPEGIVAKGERVLAEMSDEAVKDFDDAIRGFIAYQPPKNWAQVLTRFVDDNELWWYKNRPFLAEW